MSVSDSIQLVIKKRLILTSIVLFSILIILGIYTTYSLYKLNIEVERTFESSKIRTEAIYTANDSVNHMEKALIKLIAVSDKASIREAAIASILATSILDEKIQNLQSQLPNNNTVSLLALSLNEIKPHRMKIIGYAKRNQDQMAFEIIEEITPKTLDIARNLNKLIKEDQADINQLLINFKQSEINTLVVVIIIITMTIGLLVVVNTRLQSAKLELDKLNHELEGKVKARTDALKHSFDEIQTTLMTLQLTQSKLVESEKMASLGCLAAGISHELNTPIGICLTSGSYLSDSARLLKEKYAREDLARDDFDEFINTIEQSLCLILSNLSRSSNLVKAFKKLSIQQSSETPRQVNFCNYINEIIFTLKPKLKGSQYIINLDCSEAVEVELVVSVLEEIMTNLIMNSLQHGFENLDRGEVFIHVSEQDDKIRLTYSDSGRGVAEEDFEKIFEPFFTTQRGLGRNGLGLTIVYNLIVHSLQGSISCRHDTQGHTLFEIELPKKQGG
ncbi:histidine kinase [Shewanella psychrophila]|uniref:histidine kinase n=1 Tax=Shewanella psychrophila TaxID=225848 RepID=A0A1S6HX13_9GAMM|nr:ATP-binding protein [Shewanella psychrophila]AQS40117.1 histidine kinase [Shewanella psychrophila]